MAEFHPTRFAVFAAELSGPMQQVLRAGQSPLRTAYESPFRPLRLFRPCTADRLEWVDDGCLLQVLTEYAVDANQALLLIASNNDGEETGVLKQIDGLDVVIRRQLWHDAKV